MPEFHGTNPRSNPLNERDVEASFQDGKLVVKELPHAQQQQGGEDLVDASFKDGRLVVTPVSAGKPGCLQAK